VAAASGNVLEVASLEARVSSLQARQSLLEVEMLIDDLQYQLADLLGFAAGTRFELAEPEPQRVQMLTLDEYVTSALRQNPEVLAARATLQKAESASRAARLEYVPDLGVALTHLYQSALPFFPKSSFGFGVQLQWNVWDFGKRSSLIQERQSQVAQATADLRRIEGKVRGDVERAFRQVDHATTALELAREAAALRAEAQRLGTLQRRAGFTLQAQALGSDAEAQQAEVDVLKAEFGHRLAIAQLREAVGSASAP
jgi:outer membrane protein TolC